MLVSNHSKECLYCKKPFQKSREPAQLGAEVWPFWLTCSRRGQSNDGWMVVILTAYRKGEMKELDGSFSLFKAVEVDKPLVLFTGSL